MSSEKEIKRGDLKRFREAHPVGGKPMSRLELAKLLGYQSDSTVWRWEEGDRPIPSVAKSIIRRVFDDFKFKT